MQAQLAQYRQLLVAEQSVKPDRIALCTRNDSVYCLGNHELADLAEQILRRLDCAAVIVAEPLHPFPAFLLQRSDPQLAALVPKDSESRSSLHDIPLIRHGQEQQTLLDAIDHALRKRKGCIVEGIGMISQGGLTVEQAYIAWSSLLHATTIKYFEDLLAEGPCLPEEAAAVALYRTTQLQPLILDHFTFLPAVPDDPAPTIQEMSRAGKATVALHLVDSFFGNISCRTAANIYISQTSARLDELAHQTDSVPFDGSSTAGITASSELPAHLAIYRATGCKTIIHGPPRFPVIMSFFATPDASGTIAWVGTVPVAGGEGGVGGLAESLPAAFCATGAKTAIVKGHGVFALGGHNFGEALTRLAEVEQYCRDVYFSRLSELYHI